MVYNFSYGATIILPTSSLIDNGPKAELCFSPAGRGSGGYFMISDELKQKIDDWVKREGRNEYGDPKDTLYAGGNPLFDERSPGLKDRYEYILKRNPKLQEELEK